MNKVVSGTDMKKVDSYTINELGIPSLELMERAALSVADFICENQSNSQSILVVCGVGNNGGDGLAVARLLNSRDYNVTVCIVGNRDKATEQFNYQLKLVEKEKVLIVNEFVDRDIIVDGIFGVGLSRNIEGTIFSAIEQINNSKAIKYAIDIPSGIDSNTGKILGIAIKADYTIAIGSLKTGIVLYPGAEYCGEIKIADIGFPEEAYRGVQVMKNLSVEDLSLIPKRPNYSNKGTFGKVLIIAGSEQIFGAAYLCAYSAFRSGIGMVKILTVEENKLSLQRLIPEAMITIYDPQSLDEQMVKDSIDWCDVIAIGPGLSTKEHSFTLTKLALDSRKPIVVDADSINVISNNGSIISLLHNNTIITPHVGEMSRFSNKQINEIKDNIIDVATEISKFYNINVVLKDARTVISTKEELYINTSGNNGMATAGSGDVLTGIIAALLARGISVNLACALGVFIHGLAGDVAANKYGKTSMMATDIVNQLPKIFKQIEKE